MARPLDNIVSIENVVAHLYNRVTYEDIVAWLDNFSNEDRDTALQLLGYVNLFTSDRIYDTLKYYIGQIVNDYNEDIFIIAVGKKESVAGKTDIPKRARILEGVYGGQSGQLIAYYARKITEKYYKKIIVLEERDLKRIRKNYKNSHCVIVLIDDIFGTGDTLLQYYKRLKIKLRMQWTVVGLSIAYMQAAVTALEPEGVKIYGEKILPIFDAIRRAEWTGENKASVYQNLALKYGKILNGKRGNRIKPLGYKNSQALVIFEYGVPNNTLPIIWESKRINAEGKTWVPLFSRNIIGRLSAYSKRRNNIQRCYIMAWKRGLQLENEAGQMLPLNEAVNVFSVLSILEHHKDSVVITNVLCINQSDYEKIIDIAKKNDLIDNTFALKEKAISALAAMKAASNKEIDNDMINNQMYLPA